MPHVRPQAFAVFSTFVALGALAACPGEAPEVLPPTFTNVKDVVFPRCSAAACHGGSAAGGLDLITDPHAALVDASSVLAAPGAPRVKPGDPDESVLYRLLTGPVGAVERMPPGVVLDEADVDLVRRWIAAGAKDD